jgi:hypothetical protein
MAGMTSRTRMALIVPALGLAGVLGLAGCGAAAPTPGDLADEATALAQVGFDTGLQDTPSAPASAGPAAPAGDRHPGHRPIRRYLRKNTLHGEVTVQRKDGTKTIVVQRGAITSVGGGSLTVKSADGYTLTWTTTGKVTVVQNRKRIDASALKAGEQIGVAGTRNGSADDARLIAVK